MKKLLQRFDTLGLLLLVAAMLSYLVSNVWEKWIVGLAIAGIVLVAIGIAANYRQILTSLGKRSTKYASNYVISIILVIAVVAGLNYIGQRHTKRFDMTSSGKYTLAPQTIQVLEKLGSDVDVKAFFPGGDYAPLKELLVEYRTTSRHIKFQFVDPDKQPDLAKQYEVTVYGTFQNMLTGSQLKFGTLVVSYGNRREKIEKRSEEVQEQDLTNAIIKAGRSEAKNIYFIQGHGEKDLSDADRPGYSEAKAALENQGYKVETVNLAAEGKIPPDAKVLILAGPTKELFPQELQLINDFLSKGDCGFFVLTDPSPAPSFDTFLKGWGAQVDKDVVLDNSNEGRLMGSTIPIVRNYENHRITENFKLTTVFPATRSIQPEKEIPAGTKVEILFKSNAASWGETDLNGLQKGEASFDASKDLKGPLSLAVAATKEIKPPSDKNPAVKTRIIVTGTSAFPINALFRTGGNGNLFLNMVSWLAQDEDLISIRPKAPEDRRILLSQSQLAALRLITVLGIPLIAVIIGFAVVWTRRRR
jgi:ABC-type uncharacterized transport system involved in gliding motility auxiliary subunit